MKKTNKTFKRFAAITSASLLAACAVAPVAFNVFAAETKIDKGSITIKTEETDHNYSAYQVFDGDLSKDTDTGAITFSNIEWGTGVVLTIPNPKFETDPTAPETLNLYDELMKLDIAFSNEIDNEDFDESQPESDTNKKKINVAFTKAKEVAEVLQTEYTTPGTTALFANVDKVAALFAQFKGTVTKTVSNITETDVDPNTDGTQKGYVFSDLKAGYYFVEEIAADNDDKLAEGEAKTKYLLQVAGDALVSPKADAPKVMKKVQEDSKTTADKVSFDSATANYQLAAGYNDVADYSIGDDINFRLYGTLPSSFANYKGYYYEFTDTMGKGLDLVDGADEGTTISEADFVVKVTDGDKVVTLDSTQFVYIPTLDDEETTTVNEKGFRIIIPDLKKIDMDSSEDGIQTMTSSAIITVDYVAELNANAVIGNDGNPNDVYLTYSNNSNTAQGGLNNTNDGPKDETGNTAKDYNVVFTYKLDVTKKLGESGLASDEAGKKAGFRLYNADKSKVATFDNANKFTGWVDSVVVDEYETAGNEIFTTADGTFSFIGIQDGTYYLTETTVPTGYNRMEDKKVVIAADTSNASEGTCQNYIETLEVGEALTKLEINFDGTNGLGNIAEGTVAMTVINNKGNELPGTGGIGTTIFYLGGGAMAAIGGIYLISKRRMRKSEE